VGGPALRRSDDEFALGPCRQVLVTGDVAIGARGFDGGVQAAHDGPILDVARRRVGSASAPMGLPYRKRVDLRWCQAMAVRQAGQHASPFVEHVAGKDHIDQTVALAARVRDGTCAGRGMPATMTSVSRTARRVTTAVRGSFADVLQRMTRVAIIHLRCHEDYYRVMAVYSMEGRT
jgi:hypothetical protein